MKSFMSEVFPFKRTPIVHSITNYVTVNDCANIILAAGGSPIMADDLAEVEEIVSISEALVINIGTLNERTIRSMFAAARKANDLGIPVILDPVGAGASHLRNETALQLLREVRFAVIRGNISEMKFLANGSSTTKGVDADVADKVTAETLDSVVHFAKEFAGATGSIIAITGSLDIIASSEKAYVVENGHPLMSRVTGTGCMLSAVVGSFLGGNPDTPLESTAAAVIAMGLCGELAYEDLATYGEGTSTFKMRIIDRMSLLDSALLEKGAKLEIR